MTCVIFRKTNLFVNELRLKMFGRFSSKHDLLVSRKTINEIFQLSG